MKFRVSSSVPVLLQTAEGVRPAPQVGGNRRPLWLLAPELCVFTELDMRNVPARLRARAMSERARQLSPFPATGWHAADSEGWMALWCWDASRVRAAMDGTPGDRDWELLPEQLFVAPEADACRRRSGAIDILERWRDGRLVFSAPLPPEGGAHPLWLRAAGLPADAEPPHAKEEYAPRRWDQRRGDWRRLLGEPAAAGYAALALAALWLLWSLGTLAGWQFANQRLEQRTRALDSELAPALAQRDEAIRLAGRARTLSQLLGPVTALEAAAEFEHLAGARYGRLLGWEFSGRSLRATLEDSAPDNRAYVESLQQSPWFERVGIQTTARADQISIDITLHAAPGAAPLYLADEENDAG